MNIRNNRTEARSTSYTDADVKLILCQTRMVLHRLRHSVRVGPDFLHVHPLEGIAKVALA